MERKMIKELVIDLNKPRYIIIQKFDDGTIDIVDFYDGVNWNSIKNIPLSKLTEIL